MLNLFILLKKSFKQFNIIIHINSPSSFSNTMHSQLRCTNIRCFNTSFSSGNRTNGTSTRRVILYYEVLKRNIVFIGYYSQKTLRNCIRSIPLISINLQNNPSIKFTLMISLMLIRITRMN